MTVTIDLFKMKLLMPDEVWYFYFLVQFVGCKVLHYLGKNIDWITYLLFFV